VPDPTGSAEQRYRLLVEQIPAITDIADFQGIRPFLYVSPQAEAMLGYPAEQWVADVTLWERPLHPEDRERVLAEEQRTMEAEETFESEYRLVARDGRVVWIWERDTIIRDQEGKPIGSQGVLVDVTELKQTQLALADSEDLLREERDRAQRYLDIAATMITVLGADGTVQLANRRACEVVGYDEAELRGKDWFDVIVPVSDREPTRGRLQAADGGRDREHRGVRQPSGLEDRRGAADLMAQHGAARRGGPHRRHAELG
jgi:PAS domain S-box-containing protein